jgi:hypothetical protein
MPVLHSALASRNSIIGPYGPKNGAGTRPLRTESENWEKGPDAEGVPSSGSNLTRLT